MLRVERQQRYREQRPLLEVRHFVGSIRGAVLRAPEGGGSHAREAFEK